MISVIIGTYGDDWLARNRQVYDRAIESVRNQTSDDVELILSHETTLQSARNLGARKALGRYLVFLDADDWLDPDFCERIVEPEDVLQPKTAYHRGGVQGEVEYLEPYEDLLDGNHLIIGCPVKREVFMDVGGFDDYHVFEDWALWLKVRQAGGTFGKTTGVYNIDTTEYSRNHESNWGDILGQVRGRFS